MKIAERGHNGTTLVHQYEEGSPTVTMLIDRDATLDEICDAFTYFLKACGYVFDGEVILSEEKYEIVKKETKEKV